MIPLISFFVVVTLSLIIERIATVALTLTGLSRDGAAFQARSAFTGTGFTTSEAEQVLSHPARRRIIMLLMGMRGFEVIAGVSTLVLAFVGTSESRVGVVRAFWLCMGLVVLWLLASSPWVNRHLSKLIARALQRWTTLDVRDYTTLLGLTDGHSVLEMLVDEDSWLAYKQLNALDLPEEGVRVLGIRRADGGFVGAPHGASVIHPRDTLILYGRAERLAEIAQRQTGLGGDQAHDDAVDAQILILQDQDQQEQARQKRRHHAHAPQDASG